MLCLLVLLCTFCHLLSGSVVNLPESSPSAGYYGYASRIGAGADVLLDVVSGKTSNRIDSVNAGSFVRLRATLKRTRGHQGLRMTNCTAYESREKMRRVAITDEDGCGLGQLFNLDEGFEASPPTETYFTAYSPVFQMIKFSSFESLYFECEFLTCASRHPNNTCEMPHCNKILHARSTPSP